MGALRMRPVMEGDGHSNKTFLGAGLCGKGVQDRGYFVPITDGQLQVTSTRRVQIWEDKEDTSPVDMPKVSHLVAWIEQYSAFDSSKTLVSTLLHSHIRRSV